MSKKDTENSPFPCQIKPLKRVSLNLPFYEVEKPGQERWRILKKYQVKNPKWASLRHEASYEENYSGLKFLQKCKSLQLTSIAFKGRQVGATVGHFNGEIKHLEKVSRHLRKLDFGAGAVSKRRFNNMKRWITKLKYLNDLSIVPYWFPVDYEYSVQDFHKGGRRSIGVVRLIQLLRTQIRKLSLFGFVQEDVLKNLDITLLNRLQQFTLKTAFRPKDCDGHPEGFSDIHLKFIKEALKSKALNVLTLHCEQEFILQNFLKSLKDLITPIKKPFVVSIKADYLHSEVFSTKTREWLKSIFRDIPTNLKLNFENLKGSYFLSLPQRIEVTGNQS